VATPLRLTRTARFRTAIHRKRPGLLTKKMLLLHDNARPHSANQTTVTLRSFKWEVLQHPTYSPDLAHERFPLVWTFKTLSFGRTLSWQWCGWKSSARVVPTATKRILRCRFPGTCEMVRQVFKLYGDYVEK
jgi:hypothetical protein